MGVSIDFRKKTIDSSSDMSLIDVYSYLKDLWHTEDYMSIRFPMLVVTEEIFIENDGWIVNLEGIEKYEQGGHDLGFGIKTSKFNIIKQKDHVSDVTEMVHDMVKKAILKE